MDEESMKDFVERPQTRIGVVTALTLNKMGGEASQGMDPLPKKGTITYTFTKGAFVNGLSPEIARAKQNSTFYGKEVTPGQVLFKKNSVALPEDSLIPDTHKKLGMLSGGETWVPSELDNNRSGRFYDLAVQAEEEESKKAKEKK